MTLESKGQSNIFQRHSILIFFVLTYTISWSIWGSLYFISPNGYDVNGGASVLLLGLLGGIGSSISGITVTRIALGKEGLRSLFSRLKQRASPVWYLIAIFTVPILLLITSVIIGRDLESDIVSKLSLGVMVGVVAALIEEFGWRGFALPALQRKYNSAIISSLMLGLIWGFWHMLPSYWGNGSQYTSLWLPNFLIFAFSLMAYTVFLAWVFNRTRGNMLIAVSLHATYTGSQFVLFPLTSTPIENMFFTGVFMALLWVVAVLLIVIRPKGMTAESAYKLDNRVSISDKR